MIMGLDIRFQSPGKKRGQVFKHIGTTKKRKKSVQRGSFCAKGLSGVWSLDQPPPHSLSTLTAHLAYVCVYMWGMRAWVEGRTSHPLCIWVESEGPQPTPNHTPSPCHRAVQGLEATTRGVELRPEWHQYLVDKVRTRQKLSYYLPLLPQLVAPMDVCRESCPTVVFRRQLPRRRHL